MSKLTNPNLTPATGAVAIFDLLTFLTAQLKWVLLEDSDGSTHEADVPANGATLTGGGAGAGGLGNANAWFRVREPNASVDPLAGAIAREWTFQRDATNNTDWRIKMSSLDGFIGGTPGATQTPSAVDEQILLGSGTDAAPVHAATFGIDGTYRWHLSGYDVAEDGVFPFYAFSSDNGTGVPRTLLFQESLDAASYPALVGTRAVPTTGEPDPALYGAGYSASSGNFESGTGTLQWSGTSGGQKAWFAMNGSNGQTPAFVVMQGQIYRGSTNDIGAPADVPLSDGFGTNPLDGSDGSLPILAARAAGLATQVGVKGFTAHLRWTNIDRGYPDTMDVGADRFVYARHLLIPFADGVAPAV